MDVLIDQMTGTLSQCVSAPNHHNVYFRCVTILYANYNNAPGRAEITPDRAEIFFKSPL